MKAAFWQVQPKHLDALDAGNAVDVLRELLCSEAGRLGISLTSVDVPSALTTKDGGIDGEVRRVPENDGDLLFEGITRYQVKTGSFSLAKSEKGLKEVLLRPNPRKKKGTMRSLTSSRGCATASTGKALSLSHHLAMISSTSTPKA